jgi:hypothetical protein
MAETTFPDNDLRKMPRTGGAKSGAAGSGTGPHGAAAEAGDPDLARVVAAWPGLPPEVRAAVLALVDGAEG